MTEADILAMTYTDRCTVYRPGKVQLASGESVFRTGLEGAKVYEALPCALSSPSGGKLERGKDVARVDADFWLFVRPEVEIEAGDTVSLTRLGCCTVTLAGLAERHPSHCRVPLRLERGMA